MNKKLLEAIQKVWEHYPSLRLCQMIYSCFPGNTILCYVKDDDLLKMLKHAYPEIFED